MPCIMQKIESGLLTFIVFKMLGKTKKPSQLIGKSEKVQINEWMNEWKACWGKGWKKLQSCMLAQLIGHMCNRCHLSSAIVYIASLFFMVLFIHIHNWSNCRRKSFFIPFSTRFISVNLLIFSPEKSMAWNVCPSC